MSEDDTLFDPLLDQPEVEDFPTLLKKSFANAKKRDNRIMHGKVVQIGSDAVLVDVGLKSEGLISIKEFMTPDKHLRIKEGDTVDVYLERMEDKHGQPILSREKAKQEEIWQYFEQAQEKQLPIEGVITSRVKSGFTVILNDPSIQSATPAFLPSSQVDINPIKDFSTLYNKTERFMILKIDRVRGNVVVSRRAVLKNERNESFLEIQSQLIEGKVLPGFVKNITDYGAFIDLGGIDGLVHITDLTWRRVSHPAHILQIGQAVNVKVLSFDAESQRLSLGIKQLEADPWDTLETRYPLYSKVVGRVTSITDYGAFIELEPGIEGLVHISELSWKKNIHPSKVLSTSQEVEVMIWEIHKDSHRLNLSLRQCVPNPWEQFQTAYPVDSVLEGKVKNITEYGIFIGLPYEMDGLVYLSDIDWDKTGPQALNQYRRKDSVKVKVLGIDIEKERISLGIKQLSEDPFILASRDLKEGSVVTCVVNEVTSGGISVRLENGYETFIRKGEIAKDRTQQNPSLFTVDQSIQARVTEIDFVNRKVTLSIRSLEIEEEMESVAAYGSGSSNVVLGDIFDIALEKKPPKSKKKKSKKHSEESFEEDF